MYIYIYVCTHMYRCMSVSAGHTPIFFRLKLGENKTRLYNLDDVF